MGKSYHLAFENAGQYSSMRIFFNEINPQSRVLDVGCAVGDLGTALYQRKQCRIWGIEYDPVRAQQARKTNAFRDVVQFDLNNLSEEGIHGLPEKFDFIILGDVLEHLQNPDRVLKLLIRYLDKNGKLLLSIPNVAHCSVKCGLLLDEFKYTDIGLLDESHLRFFTWQSVAQFCAYTGIKIEKSERSYLGVECFGCYPNYGRLPVPILQYVFQDPHAFVCQYILTATPVDMPEKELLAHNLDQLACRFEDFPDFMLEYVARIRRRFGIPDTAEKKAVNNPYGFFCSIKETRF